jgi:catechol 2,3-dioxygenase-like lactoylglutathione lyase family enzyme
MTTSPVRTFEVHAIGEVALRVRDMDAMVDFYHGKFGLAILRRFGNDVTALKIADGVQGQIQTLTLFGPGLPPNHPTVKWTGLEPEHSTLHHFALTVAAKDYDRVLNDLAAAGIETNSANHRWNGWRGIYVRDPEGNIMELVSYHEGYDEGKAGTYDFGKLHGATTGNAFD